MAYDASNENSNSNNSNNNSKYNYQNIDGTMCFKDENLFYVSEYISSELYLKHCAGAYFLIPDDVKTPPVWKYPIGIKTTSKFGIAVGIWNNKKCWKIGNVMESTTQANKLWNDESSILWQKLNLYESQQWIITLWDSKQDENKK